MSANGTEQRRRVPWWAYLAWMDDETLAWRYDLDLYGPETWPEEFDEPVRDARAADVDQRDPGLNVLAEVFGRLPRAIREIASRFRRKAGAGPASASGTDRGLALPASRT